MASKGNRARPLANMRRQQSDSSLSSGGNSSDSGSAAGEKRVSPNPPPARGAGKGYRRAQSAQEQPVEQVNKPGRGLGRAASMLEQPTSKGSAGAEAKAPVRLSIEQLGAKAGAGANSRQPSKEKDAPSPVKSKEAVTPRTGNRLAAHSGHWGTAKAVKTVTSLQMRHTQSRLTPQTARQKLMAKSGAKREGSKEGADQNMGTKMAVEQILLELPMFRDADPNLAVSLASKTVETPYRVGEEIVKEGTLGAALLVVIRGVVSISFDDLEVGRLNAGQLFGEAMFLGVVEHWQVTLKAATSTCSVAAIYREDFIDILGEMPDEAKTFEVMRAIHGAPGFAWLGTLENRIELFHGLSEECMRQISDQSIQRLYFPGETIIHEGEQGSELYIIVLGKVSIEIAGKTVRETEVALQDQGPRSSLQRTSRATLTGRMGQPLAFGEMCMLGLAVTRSATLTARSVVQARVFYRPCFLRAVEGYNEAVSYQHLMVQRQGQEQAQPNVVPRQLEEVAMFRDAKCEEPFLNFLSEHLEDRLFLSGQTIIKENAEDDGSLYLLSQGHVKVMKQGKVVAQLSGGACFGEMTVLGIASKRTSSVVTVEPCYMRVLHQRVVMRGLELFPEERKRVLYQALKKTVGNQGSTTVPGDLEPERAMLIEVLAQSPLFTKTSTAFLEMLGASAVNRIYIPGELVMREGEEGQSMFFIVSGRAGVFVAEADATIEESAQKEKGALGGDRKDSYQSGNRNSTAGSEVGEETPQREGSRRLRPPSDRLGSVKRSRISVLTAGSVLGELAALGISETRSATIQAESLCSMWEITNSDVLNVLKHFPDARHHFSLLIKRRLERTAVPRISGLQLFKNYEQRFRTLLGFNADRHVHFPGQEIVREGKVATSCHVVNIGLAAMRKRGVMVKMYTAGGHFGSTVMLGIHTTYVGSVYAVQTCHVLSISRTHYFQGLEEYPAAAAHRDLKRKEKAATEQLREALKSTTVRKIIWDRMEKDLAARNKMSGSIRQEAFHAWWEYTSKLTEARKRRIREQEQCERAIQAWVSKRREAIDHMNKKREMEQDVEAAKALRGGSPIKRDSLPKVPVTTDAESAESVQLRSLQAAWPTPRPSKYYNLNVWNVLARTLETPDIAGQVLPLLADLPGSACAGEAPPRTSTAPGGPRQVASRASAMSSPVHERHRPGTTG